MKDIVNSIPGAGGGNEGLSILARIIARRYLLELNLEKGASSSAEPAIKENDESKNEDLPGNN